MRPSSWRGPPRWSIPRTAPSPGSTTPISPSTTPTSRRWASRCTWSRRPRSSPSTNGTSSAVRHAGLSTSADLPRTGTVAQVQLRIFTEPQQAPPSDDLLAVAQATERLGFDGFFRSDHYLVMGGGDGLPGPTDAWITLAALARETSRIRLGTLVTAATFRHPGPLAISIAQ